MASPRTTRVPAGWALALLLFGTVFAVLFRPVVAGDATVVHGDGVSVSLPLQHVLASALAEGRIPLWSDEIYGGHPLFAEGQGGFAHPLNLLLFGLLPALGTFARGEPGLVAPATVYAHGLLHVLCGLLAALGTYALCRCYRLGVLPSMIGGLALAGSQDWLWQSSNSAIAGASAWAPWILLAVERWWQRPETSRAVALAVALCLAILAGYPQVLHGSAIFALVLIGVRVDRAWLAKPWQHIGTGLLALLLAGGLSAIQLFPTIELVGESVRAEGVGLVSSASPSMQLRGLLYSIGQRAAIDPGLGSVLLLGLACVSLRASRNVIGLLLASAVLFQLALADHSPLYRALHHVLPGLDSFRITHLYATLGLIGIAVLAGFGAQRLSELSSLRAIGPRTRIGWITAFAALAVASFVLHDEFVPAPTYVFPIVALLLVVALVAAARSSWVPAALLVTVLCEIVALRVPLHDFVDTRVVLAPPPIVRALVERDRAEPAFRVGNVPHFFSYIGFASASAPDLERLTGLFLSSVDAGSNLLWSIPSVNANLALPLARRSAVDGLIESEVRGEAPRLPGERFIDGLGVRYFVVHKQHRAGPFAEDLAERFFDPDYRFYLLENQHAKPRIRFVAASDARPVKDAAQAAARLARDRDGLLFVEAEALAFPDDGGNPVRPAASFVTSALGPERNVAVVDVQVPGFLVVADAMYPGWKALVNGEPAPLFAANALEKAVPLGVGRYHVEVLFEPASFRNGARVSAVSVVLAVLLVALGRFRGARRTDSSGTDASR